MRWQISDDQVESYQTKGYILIEDFLDPEELENWRLQVGEAVDQRVNAPRERADGDPWLVNTADNSNDFYSQVFLQCIKLADTHAGVRELMLDPRLGEMASTLAKVDGVRIWHDQALIKPPFGNPTGWHLDNPYWSFFSRDAISLWVPLDDATLSNGCLYYSPGTHKLARFENSNIGPNMADLFQVYPEWKAIDPVAVPCMAGSAVFHNGLTAHGAGANMTNRPRRAMTCAYMPDGSTFNGAQNVLPKSYFETLQMGQVLDDPVMNPLVWKR